jgi:hypothetical protein
VSTRTFTTTLKKLEFVEIRDIRGGGIRVRTYRKRLKDRDVEVELWGDGNHRATHSVHGCSDTFPTDFFTPPQMLEAIEKESTRTDNKWLGEDNLKWG